MFSTPRFYRNFWVYTFSTPCRKRQASPNIPRKLVHITSFNKISNAQIYH
ncbi:hypothetical protein HanRHA438_Chr08g0338681 [Helianthus annuus]|nr:hypothetical protein HanRHA438_Chr08g0338681 [Helianthus annuus]